jgi:YidC/Oxa1 family membrane protein insertase
VYDFFVSLLNPLMWGEAWVMNAWHSLFTLIGIPYDSGWGWALSIVGLTVVVRFLMIPLFVKQIHASRRMQLIQPEMQKIQAKYKGKSDPESRQKMTSETMDLYKRTGSNPFSSCLPILLQSPFFFALFQLLNNLPHVASGAHAPIGPITPDVASVIEKSTIFGAQLSATFVGSEDLNVKILTAVLIVLMSLSTFTTQRQLMRKNMPDAALDNPYMKQQKVILYLMPIFFAISGINFPIGVLLYWLTTNVWSMGQQFYVIRRMPAPGSAAERAYEERQKKRGKTIKKLHIPGLGDTTRTRCRRLPRAVSGSSPRARSAPSVGRPAGLVDRTTARVARTVPAELLRSPGLTGRRRRTRRPNPPRRTGQGPGPVVGRMLGVPAVPARGPRRDRTANASNPNGRSRSPTLPARSSRRTRPSARRVRPALGGPRVARPPRTRPEPVPPTGYACEDELVPAPAARCATPLEPWTPRTRDTAGPGPAPADRSGVAR